MRSFALAAGASLALLSAPHAHAHDELPLQTAVPVPTAVPTTAPTHTAAPRPHPTPSASRSLRRVAAMPSDWVALGQCEASGDARANTGNGYSGLFQFLPETWTSHGGGRFASYAWQATASEQLVIARRVLDDEGVAAWPVCGPRVGLRVGD